MLMSNEEREAFFGKIHSHEGWLSPVMFPKEHALYLEWVEQQRAKGRDIRPAYVVIHSPNWRKWHRPFPRWVGPGWRFEG